MNTIDWIIYYVFLIGGGIVTIRAWRVFLRMLRADILLIIMERTYEQQRKDTARTRGAKKTHNRAGKKPQKKRTGDGN